MTTKRWQKVLIVYAALLILGAYGMGRFLSPWMKGRVERQIQSSVPYEFVLADLEFTFPNRIVLTGLEFTDPEAGVRVLAIEQIVLVLDLARLLKRQTAFSSIVVSRPRFTWDRKTQSWRRYLSRAPIPSDTGPVPAPAGETVTEKVSLGGSPAPVQRAPGEFHANWIRVSDGRITLKDSSRRGRRGKYQIDSIQLDAGPVHRPQGGRIDVDLKAHVPGPDDPANLSVRGWIDPDAGDLELDMSVHDLDVARLVAYASEGPAAGFTQGYADAEIHAAVLSHKLKGRCKLSLRDLAFASGEEGTDLLGIPAAILVSTLAGSANRIELEFPIETRLDQGPIDWDQVFADAAREGFQNWVGYDLNLVIGAGQEALDKFLGPGESLEEALPGGIRDLQEDIEGLLKDMLKRVQTPEE